MARHLIQSATTGETRIVGDAALPFFPGYVIKDTLEDGQPPAVYYDGGESDLRYVNVSELSNPESAPSIALRAAFVPSLPTGLRRYYAALATRDTAKVKIGFIGDSHTEGEGATTYDRRWVSRVRDRLRTATQLPVGGPGYIKPAKTGETTFTWPIARSAGSSWINYVGANDAVQLPPGESITFSFIGTGFRLAYFPSSGNNFLDITLDGTTTLKVIDTSSGGPWYSSATLSDGSHTVTVRATTTANGGRGTDAFITAVDLLRNDATSGLNVYEMGAYGSSTSDLSTTTGTPGAASGGWLSGIASLWGSLDLAVISYGANDHLYYTGGAYTIPPGDFQLRLQGIISQLRSPACQNNPNLPVLLIAMPERDTTGMPAGFSPWSQYVAAMQAAAAADANAAFVNCAPLLGPIVTDTVGLYADPTHMNDKGHALLADALMPVFAGPAGGRP